MSESTPEVPGQRGTISLTHKQAGLSATGLATFFTIMHFLSANYASKGDVKVLSDRIDSVMSVALDVKTIAKDGFKGQTDVMAAHIEDETSTHRRIMDTTRTELAQEKSDRIRDDEGVTKRIDLVMELFKLRHTKTN